MKGIIFSYAKDWFAATNKKAKGQARKTVMLNWIMPPPNFVKINVDASLNRHGSIGAGGITRDSKGSWISGFMISLGSGDIQQVEAWGLFYGMQLAIRCGQQRVEFESDSATLISLLTDKDVDMHPLGTILMNCQKLSRNFSMCTFKHVHREKNNAADFLAKASLGNDHGIIWLDASPPAMANILADDIAGVATARSIPATTSCCPAVSFNHHNEPTIQIECNGNANGLAWTDRFEWDRSHDAAQWRNVPTIAEAGSEDYAEGVLCDNTHNAMLVNIHVHAKRDGHVIPND